MQKKYCKKVGFVIKQQAQKNKKTKKEEMGIKKIYVNTKIVIKEQM